MLPEVQRYLDWKARDRVEVKAALDAMVQQHKFQRPGDVVSLAVVRKIDDMLIGQVSLRWTDATAGQAELRFILSPAQRRQGYAREAVKAALDLGFQEFGLHRVFARCSAKNLESAKLLKSLGLRLEAHYREHALFQGDWDEELHFAILDREWLRGSKVKELTRHMVA
jgi:RimJ/RimL family protein N-acetyltransferase